MQARTHRTGVGLLATLLTGALLLAGAVPTFAGDTRNVTIGSPGANGLPTGSLTTTAVSEGEQALLTVMVHNAGPQTINNVEVRIGHDSKDDIAAGAIPTFPVAFPEGNDSELDILSMSPSKTCTAPDDGPVSCTVGSLGKNKSFTINLLFTPDTGAQSLKATVRVSETSNDNGGAANIDTFAARGLVSVLTPTCGGLYGYLPAGLEKRLATTALDCDQAIDLYVPLDATNKNAVVKAVLVELGDADTSTGCVSGTSCFGDAFEISVNDGTKVNGYIEVTLVWNTLPDGFNINKAGLVHIGQTKTVVIDTSKKSQCTAQKTTDCWTESIYDGETWEFTVRFPENGVVRGK